MTASSGQVHRTSWLRPHGLHAGPVGVIMWIMSVLPSDEDPCEGRVHLLHFPVPKGAWPAPADIRAPKSIYLLADHGGKQRGERKGPGVQGECGPVCGRGVHRSPTCGHLPGGPEAGPDGRQTLLLSGFYEFLCHGHLLLWIVLEAKCRAEITSGMLCSSPSWAPY